VPAFTAGVANSDMRALFLEGSGTSLPRIRRSARLNVKAMVNPKPYSVQVRVRLLFDRTGIQILPSSDYFPAKTTLSIPQQTVSGPFYLFDWM
jgi:hypothetical protein